MKIKIIIGIAILSSIALFYTSSVSGLGNGYNFIGDRMDDMRIVKDDKIIVGATIVSYDVVFSDFVVGLRLPADYLECDNGGGYKIVIRNSEEYFVLSTETGKVWNYTSKEKFETKLVELNLKPDVVLDYSKFKYIWDIHSNYYKNIDYTTCKTLAKRP